MLIHSHQFEKNVVLYDDDVSMDLCLLLIYRESNPTKKKNAYIQLLPIFKSLCENLDNIGDEEAICHVQTLITNEECKLKKKILSRIQI